MQYKRIAKTLGCVLVRVVLFAVTIAVLTITGAGIHWAFDQLTFAQVLYGALSLVGICALVFVWLDCWKKYGS